MRKAVSKNVIILGIVSFLTDVSSEMIMPILPLFLAHVLGAGTVSIGFIEGIVESTSSLLKAGSGWYSDRVRRKKPLVLAGYLLSNVVKPLLAVAGAWWQVLVVRFSDRVGKGLRTAPRDAMIAEASERQTRGKSFGIHRMMDTAGAVVGAAVAFLFLSHNSDAYRSIFAVSIIPGTLAILVLLFFVRERPQTLSSRMPPGEVGEKENTTLRGPFRRAMLLFALYAFANISYAFLILRASELGIAVLHIPLVYLVYSLIYALLAVPVGSLSDRIGRTRVLVMGMMLQGLIFLGFAVASRSLHVWLLFIVLGCVVAVTDTIPRALISDMVSSSRRGTALGLYHTAVGLAPLPANLLFGLSWSRFGSSASFATWSALMAAVGLLFLFNRRRFS